MLTYLLKRSKLLTSGSICLVLAACGGGGGDTTSTSTFDRDRALPTNTGLDSDQQTPTRAAPTSVIVRIDDVFVPRPELATAGDDMSMDDMSMDDMDMEQDLGVLIGSVYVAGDASGFENRTLYTFASDMPNESTCINTCETNWPPYIVQEELSDALIEEVAEVGTLGTIVRENGTLQVTLDGSPLYFFAGDSIPFTPAVPATDDMDGMPQMLDVNGLDVGGVWFPLGFESSNPTESAENGELGEFFTAAGTLAGDLAGFTLYTPPDDFLEVENFVPEMITLPSDDEDSDDFCDQECFDAIQAQQDMLEQQQEYAAALEMYTPLSVELAAFVRDSAIIGTMERDGIIQVTLNNLPLFFFNGDMAAGDTNGHGPDLDVPFIAAGFTQEVEAEVGLRLVATINASDAALVTPIGNGVNECPPDCQDPPVQNTDLQQILFLTGPGDGFSFQVPAEAEGSNVIGVDHFRGPGGLGLYNVEVDGAMVGTITPFSNSTDFVSLAAPNSDPDALIYLTTPLTAGQTVQITTGGPDNFLGANVGDIKMYVAEPEAYHIFNAWEEVVTPIGNGVNECPPDCQDPPVQNSDLEQLLFLTGDGDGLEFVLPASAAGATIIGANIVRVGGPGELTVFADGTEVGTIIPDENSTDFVNLLVGSVPTFFTDPIDPPLAAGQTIQILVSGGNFSAGNVSTVGAYAPAPVMDRLATFQTWTDQVTVLGNGVNECPPDCQDPPLQNSDLEQLLFITGDGDGAEFTVPASAAGAVRLGVDVFRGPGADPGEMRVVVDGAEVGTFDVVQVTENFVDLNEGARSMFFFDFDTPLTEGQVVSVQATDTFSAGNLGEIALFDVLDD